MDLDDWPLDFEGQITYFRRMNRTCPLVHSSVHNKQPMSYRSPPKLMSHNIPGACRPPAIPSGLWSNRVPVRNPLQGMKFVFSRLGL